MTPKTNPKPKTHKKFPSLRREKIVSNPKCENFSYEALSSLKFDDSGRIVRSWPNEQL